MAHYISNASPAHFQPMNANFGLLPPLPVLVKDKKERAANYAARALDTIQNVAIKL
jgi:methylenetetrahydrofolate--tRNA-(uracil-5-)-methyltransferase